MEGEWGILNEISVIFFGVLFRELDDEYREKIKGRGI